MLTQLSNKSDFKPGRVFSHRTCDAVIVDTDGTTTEINPHVEYIIINRVTKSTVYYQNITDGSTGKTNLTYACYLYKLEEDK